MSNDHVHPELQAMLDQWKRDAVAVFASDCCGAELRSISDGSMGREPGVPATCSRCGEPA